MTSLTQIIKSISPKYPWKYHENEKGKVNPAYSDLAHSCIMQKNKLYIWALRTDMVIAKGIKNLKGKNNRSYKNNFHHDSKKYLPKYLPRYGHPTLAVPDVNYDGGVFYAGWVAQRDNDIEVFMYSGRYHRRTGILGDISNFHRECIEIYIAKQYVDLQGNYPVNFHGGRTDTDYYHFKTNKAPIQKIRQYKPAYVQSVSLLSKYNFNINKNLLELLKSDAQLCNNLLSIENSSSNILNDLAIKLFSHYISKREQIVSEHSGWSRFFGKNEVYSKSYKTKVAESIINIIKGNITVFNDKQSDSLNNGKLKKYFSYMPNHIKLKVHSARDNHSKLEVSERIKRYEDIREDIIIARTHCFP